MKKTVILLIGCMFTLFTATAWADNDIPPPGSIPMSTVLQNLKAKGYEIVPSVKFKDGNYEARAISAQGQKVTVAVNAKTGEVMAAKTRMETTISTLQAVQTVEKAGYHSIYKITRHEDKYKVKALNKDNEKVEFFS